MFHPLCQKPLRGVPHLGNTDQEVQWWAIQQIGSFETKKYSKGTFKESAGMLLRRSPGHKASRILWAQGSDDPVIHWVGLWCRECGLGLSTQPHDQSSWYTRPVCSWMPECWLCTTIKAPCLPRQMCEGLFVIRLAGVQIRLRGSGGSSFLSVTVDLVEPALFHFPSDAVMISYWWSGKGCQCVPAPTVRRRLDCRSPEGQATPRKGSPLASSHSCTDQKRGWGLGASRRWRLSGSGTFLPLPFLSPCGWTVIRPTQEQINWGKKKFSMCTREVINDAPRSDRPARLFTLFRQGSNRFVKNLQDKDL